MGEGARGTGRTSARDMCVCCGCVGVLTRGASRSCTRVVSCRVVSCVREAGVMMSVAWCREPSRRRGRHMRKFRVMGGQIRDCVAVARGVPRLAAEPFPTQSHTRNAPSLPHPTLIHPRPIPSHHAPGFHPAQPKVESLGERLLRAFGRPRCDRTQCDLSAGIVVVVLVGVVPFVASVWGELVHHDLGRRERGGGVVGVRG